MADLLRIRTRLPVEVDQASSEIQVDHVHVLPPSKTFDVQDAAPVTLTRARVELLTLRVLRHGGRVALGGQSEPDRVGAQDLARDAVTQLVVPPRPHPRRQSWPSHRQPTTAGSRTS